MGINLTQIMNDRLNIKSVNNIEEEVLDTDLILAKGTNKIYDIDMSDFEGYRILVAPSELNAHIKVRQRTNFAIDGSHITSTYNQDDLIRSLGNGSMEKGYTNTGVVIGLGSTLWSDIIVPLRKLQQVQLLHLSTSPVGSLTVKIIVVKYKSVPSGTTLQTTNNGNSIMEIRKSSSIPALTNFPLLTAQDALVFDYPVEIETLEWQTNNRTSTSLNIDIKTNGVWKPLTRVISRDGTTELKHTPENIQVLKSGLWEVLEFDDAPTLKLFKFSLRKKIVSAEGIRIYINNASDSTAYAGGIVVQGRVL